MTNAPRHLFGIARRGSGDSAELLSGELGEHHDSASAKQAAALSDRGTAECPELVPFNLCHRPWLRSVS
jgi:hypothetical protein